MKLFLKGVVVGFGGIAPGLSGSILLIIFGLYRKVLDALGSLLTNLGRIHWAGVLGAVTSFPSIIFCSLPFFSVDLSACISSQSGTGPCCAAIC